MLTQHEQLVLEGDAQTQFNQYEVTSSFVKNQITTLKCAKDQIFRHKLP